MNVSLVTELGASFPAALDASFGTAGEPVILVRSSENRLECRDDSGVELAVHRLSEP